jgi:hypothetical protein
MIAKRHNSIVMKLCHFLHLSFDIESLAQKTKQYFDFVLMKR